MLRKVLTEMPVMEFAAGGRSVMADNSMGGTYAVGTIKERSPVSMNI